MNFVSKKTLFTLVLLAFVGLIFYLTLDLGRIARLVPLTIVTPALGLIFFQLLLDLVPQLAQKYSWYEKMDLFGFKRFRVEGHANPSRVAEEALRSRKELIMFFWILMLFVFIYLFGFLIAVSLHTFLHLRWRSGEGWLVSIVMTAGMWSLLHGIFVLVLDAPLYNGALWG